MSCGRGQNCFFTARWAEKILFLWQHGENVVPLPAKKTLRNMRKIFLLLVACVLAVVPAQAVLKERDLARTLGVLRAELETDATKQQAFMARYEQQGAAQHQQLVAYMNQCEQIGLMLFSQSADNTFDMAYACQQAVDLYRQLNSKNGRTLPYDRIIQRMKNEIERYDALIASLKSMPPVLEDSLLTESDSILLNAIDSLEEHIGEAKLSAMAGKPVEGGLAGLAPIEEQPREPLFLSGQQQEDRLACLRLAQKLRNGLQDFLESLEAESTYYNSVQDKVRQLNGFAQSRYKLLQDNIFFHGGSNYFTILMQFPRYYRLASMAATKKYAPFREKGGDYSEWRGVPVLFISVFVVFYLLLSLGLTYAVLRWLLPRRWRGEAFRIRRRMLTNVIGIALFAVIVMVVRAVVHRNFIQMSTEQIITMAWLLEVIFLSLYIRLKGQQMLHAALIYTPLMVLSSFVIMMRIILVPNSILNLMLPPVLLGFTLWQLWMVRRHRRALPMSDIIYSHVTSLVMVVACVATWVGFTLLAIQVLIWWTIQLAAITTITCFYDLMEMFERRHRIAEKEITQTWLYDFVNLTVVPILAVCSILASIYWSAEIFEMTSVCQKAFFKNFVDVSDLIQLSLFKICLVAALWFLFRYLNYAIRSFYAYFRLRTAPDDAFNLTLAKNIIAILTWGVYVIIVFVVLNVPKSGISIVTAGLATGLGFAMQDLIENFFYGLSLMTGRLRVGDYIECDGITGKVESITYQSTQIITGDGCVIAFLNKALFSKNFKNMTRNHSYELIKIPVGVAYGTDVNRVRQLLVEALTPVCQGENAAGQPIADPERPITVAFSGFGDSSVDLFVCIWMLVQEKFALSGRVKETIYDTLNRHHIEIPFPQRDVHIVQG